ncbi:MAG: hypothetical protein ACLFNU_13195 [Bacteroidales bacterium]
MRRLVSLALLVAFGFMVAAQGNPESYARDVIKAYKNKDLSLLEKHATAVLKYALNDAYFESSDAKPLVKIAKTWDGDIKEIRYNRVNMMGTSALLAFAYFGDNANGNLNVATLTSLNGSEWKAFSLGLSDISRDEFLEGSLEVPDDKPRDKTKTSKPKMEEAAYKGFSVEMANGEDYDNPTLEKLKKSLKTLDEENFFLTLSGKDGFIQTSVSEKGYIVQYSEGSSMFEAESYFILDKVIEIFEMYLKGEDWKSVDNWVSM